MKKLLFSALLLVAGVMSVSAIDIAKWTFDTGYDESSRIYTPNNAAWAYIKVGNDQGAPTFRPQVYVGTQSDYALTGKMKGNKNWEVTDASRFLLRFTNTEKNNITDYTDANQHNNYFEASFPTRGYININVSFTIGDGGGNSTIAKVVYSVDGGATWALKGDYKMGAHWGTYNPGSFDFTDMNNKDKVIVRLILDNDGINNYNLKYFYVSGTSDPSAPATLIGIDVDGKNYAASTAVSNTFTITDQVFTKNPVVKFNDSKDNTQNVTMTAHNDGTATGSFIFGSTTYNVVCQNYYKVQSGLVATLQGTTSGRFSSNETVAASWTSNDGKYVITPANTSNRFSSGWWGSPSTYGFCVSNTTMTINVPANIKIEGVEVLGQGYWNPGAVTADANEYYVPTSNTFGVKVVPVEPVMLVVKNPAYGKALTFTVSEHNCYIKLYGSEATGTNVTLGTGGYSTFAAEYPYTVTGATAYTVDFDDKSTATLNTIANGTIIPAGAGIVLSGTQGATVTITPSATAGAALSNNDLVGFTSRTALDQSANTYYVLGTVNDVTGFYRYTAENMPANKAALVVSGAYNAAKIAVRFNNSETTGVANVENVKSAKAVKRIMNGQLVIEKAGKMYNAAGAEMK